MLWGKKVFFMIAPTPENLKRYEKWVTSPSQGTVFLANKVRPAVQRLLCPIGQCVVEAEGTHASTLYSQCVNGISRV